ncbi:MAG TPA: THUMP domain-containing protein [Candidatus Nanoarchaeia archaeon]|nr:THUMP domain-containing protein [Candidatus Nanoarchaeia archaeon]
MKGLVIVPGGFEDIGALELTELIGAKAPQVEDSCLLFDIKKIEDLCLLCYTAQSVEKVLLLIDNFQFKDYKDFEQKISGSIKKIDSKKWLGKTVAFRVSTKKIGSDLSSEEVSARVGELIIESIKTYKQKVDLDNPDITFLVFINKDQAYLGIDFSGRDLHKREYKIFTHHSALRPTIAYSLIRLAGYSNKKKLLDPFCCSGEIAIETALFQSNYSPNFYSKDKFAFLKFKPLKKTDFAKLLGKQDKKILKIKKADVMCFDSNMLNLNAAKKNAKIAGINKLIDFSRKDTEWLDTKLGKESVDLIVTHPPESSKVIGEKDIEKVYNEFFYQAEFIVKKEGKVAVILTKSDLIKKAAAKYNFKPVHERKVYSGKAELSVVILKR